MVEILRLWRKPKFLVEEPRARVALDKFLAVARQESVVGDCLDVGCGPGEHVRYMKERGPFRQVHGLDTMKRAAGNEDRYFSTRFENFNPPQTYDAIWSSHTLEHTPNPGLFLGKLKEVASPGALICLTVPPLDHHVTVGHVTLWNAGTLLLNLVKAGFDCSDARIRKSGYNVTVMIRNRPRGGGRDFGTDPATSLRPYLPQGLQWRRSHLGIWYFKGNIRSLNWD